MIAIAIDRGASVAIAQYGETTRVSVSSNGIQSNSYCAEPSISQDGRYVAFYSYAENLVLADTNSHPDVFVHDRATGQTSRMSLDSTGTEGNGDSLDPSISGDGLLVAFASSATNLVPGDTNLASDVFVRDSRSNQTRRVSCDSGGHEANGPSAGPSISADGRFVAFSSQASNLVAGDTNSASDIFVFELASGQSSRVSVGNSGGEGNFISWEASISGDGRLVSFSSVADNIVAADTNHEWDIFVHDRSTAMTTRVSVDSGGTEGDDSSGLGVISADGRFVAFQSRALNLVPGDTNGRQDVFLHDRSTAQTSRISVDSMGGQGNEDSWVHSTSVDGRFVGFFGYSDDLVASDTNSASDAFVHDRITHSTKRVSTSSAGVQGNFFSGTPALSGDGRFVAFASDSNNLVTSDANAATDIFLHDEFSCTPTTYCTSKVSSSFCIPSIQSSGSPSLADPSAFTFSTIHMERNKSALTFFGTSGAAGNPFQGGFLCAQAPIYRLDVLNTGGSSACQGSIAYTLSDMSADSAGGSTVVVGAFVHCQSWSRDPGDPYSTNLSDALSFQICP